PLVIVYRRVKEAGIAGASEYERIARRHITKRRDRITQYTQASIQGEYLRIRGRREVPGRVVFKQHLPDRGIIKHEARMILEPVFRFVEFLFQGRPGYG